MRKLIFLTIFILILGIKTGTSFADINHGLSYLTRQQMNDGTIGGRSITGWAVIAFFFHNQLNVQAVAALRDIQTTLPERSATDIERQIIALVTAGENPRTFAGVDAVAELRGRISGNQIGQPDLINDDIFGILAFQAVGEAAPTGLTTELAAKQNADGGWGIFTGQDSSTEMTAVSLIALRDGGLPEAKYNQAIRYLQARQNNDGGFATQEGESSIGSTAWVMWMITNLGQPQSNWTKSNKTPRDFLLAQQSSDGSWESSVLVTSYSLIALSNRAFPPRQTAATPFPSPVTSTTPTSLPSILPTISPTPRPTAPPTSPLPSSPTPVLFITPTPHPVNSASPSPVLSPTPQATVIPTLAPSPLASQLQMVRVLTTPSPASRLLPEINLPILLPRITPGPTSRPTISPEPQESPLATPPVPEAARAGRVRSKTLGLISLNAGFGIALLALNSAAVYYELALKALRKKR